MLRLTSSNNCCDEINLSRCGVLAELAGSQCKSWQVQGLSLESLNNILMQRTPMKRLLPYLHVRDKVWTKRCLNLGKSSLHPPSAQKEVWESEVRGPSPQG